MSLKYLAGAAVACALALANPASAGIVNGSFESASVNPGGGFVTLGNGSTAITGWTVGGDSIDYIGGYWQPSNGSRSIDLAGNNAGSIAQTLTGLVVGATYTIGFDLAGNPDGGPTVKVAMAMFGAGSQNFLFDTSASSRAAMGWLPQSFSFVATSTSGTLSFSSGTPNSPYGPALDNVSISSSVPEPSTWAMMLLGLAGLGYIGLARRKTVKAVA